MQSPNLRRKEPNWRAQGLSRNRRQSPSFGELVFWQADATGLRPASPELKWAPTALRQSPGPAEWSPPDLASPEQPMAQTDSQLELSRKCLLGELRPESCRVPSHRNGVLQILRLQMSTCYYRSLQIHTTNLGAVRSPHRRHSRIRLRLRLRPSGSGTGTRFQHRWIRSQPSHSATAGFDMSVPDRFRCLLSSL